MSSEIEISSQIKDYSVHFIDGTETLNQTVANSKAVYIIDEKVHALYPTLLDSIPSQNILQLEATETLKTLDGAGLIFDFFLNHNINKKSEIFAIGGGIIQDTVTLATHLFHRGVNWTYIPTTLLAMSDSCIGAKAAINYKTYKNPLGAFHPPKKIFLCPEFISTLEYNDLLSGYGEIIKLNLIGGENIELLKAINNDGLLIENRANKNIPALIKSSLLIKKKYIEEDEFDMGIRRTLNYGHTFGHALESVLNYALPHGQAVVIGIDIVNFVSMKLGLTTENTFNKTRQCYDQLYTKRKFPPSTLNDILNKIAKDKKAIDGEILLAIMEKPGTFLLHPLTIQSDLSQLADEYFSQDNLFELDVA